MSIKILYIIFSLVGTVGAEAEAREDLSSLQPHDTIQHQAARPLYEPDNGDYRFCQTFKTAFDWGANCFVATGLVGTYQYRKEIWRYHSSFWNLEPISYAAVGMWVLGGALGAFFGYAEGEYSTEQHRTNPAFHLARNNVGHRILMIFHDYPRYHAVYQLSNDRPAIPDVIRLGFVYRTWSGLPIYSFLSETGRQYDNSFFGREFKWDMNVVWDIYRIRGASFYGGLGGGPAWAKDYTVATGSAVGVRSGFVHVLGGVRVNMLDYLFLETEADYEPWGVFQKLRRQHAYHPSQTVTCHIYLGMYVFHI